MGRLSRLRLQQNRPRQFHLLTRLGPLPSVPNQRLLPPVTETGFCAVNGSRPLVQLSRSVTLPRRCKPRVNRIRSLQLSFGQPVAKEPIKLTIYAPVNVSFPSVARLAVDDKDMQPAELIWRRCQPGGCVADLEIKEELLKRWRAQFAGELLKSWMRLDVKLQFRSLFEASRRRFGAVVGVQPFGGEGLSGTGPKAGGPRYLHRFATERTISIDTTAAGGNATLLSLQDDA